MDRVKHILVKVGFPGGRLGAARRLVTLKFRQRVVARTVTQHKHSNHIFSKEIILPAKKKKKLQAKARKYICHIFTLSRWDTKTAHILKMFVFINYASTTTDQLTQKHTQCAGGGHFFPRLWGFGEKMWQIIPPYTFFFFFFFFQVETSSHTLIPLFRPRSVLNS